MFKKLKPIDSKVKTQKWNTSEEIFDNPMKATSYSLQVYELTSVAEEERFHKNIVAQANYKFEFFILSHRKPKSVITFNLLYNGHEIQKIYP